MRLPEAKAKLSQRSINLAISSRGIASIHAVDSEMLKRFMSRVIPMSGRMIHPPEGLPQSQQYDPNGQVSPITK